MKLREKRTMGKITVDVELANHEDIVMAKLGGLPKKEVRRLTVSAIVDSGAAHMVIPKRAATILGLPAAGKAKVRYADGRRATRDVVEVRVTVLGRESTFQAIVEPGREDALLGAIVLEGLDFVIDCGTQSLHPRDPNWLVSEIE